MASIAQKNRKDVFYGDNARPHTFLAWLGSLDASTIQS